MLFKKSFVISLVFFAVFFGLLVYLPVRALSPDYGLTDAAQGAGLAGITDVPKLIGQIIGTALSLIGVIFFALMIYGGFLWMTARGNAEDEKKALNTIFGAVIGIIIILSAYALTTFVFKSLGGGLAGTGGGGGGGGGGGTDRNAECIKVDPAWSCNEITTCDGVTGADNTACSTDATDKSKGCIKDKCNVGTDASSSKVVCCKPKTLGSSTCDDTSTNGCAGQPTGFACTTSDGQSGQCKTSSGATCGCVVPISQNYDCMTSDGKTCNLQTGSSCPSGQVSIGDVNCQMVKGIVNNPTDNCPGGDVQAMLTCINGGGVAAESCISTKCPVDTSGCLSGSDSACEGKKIDDVCQGNEPGLPASCVDGGGGLCNCVTKSCSTSADCASVSGKPVCYDGKCVSTPKAGEACMVDSDCHSNLLKCNKNFTCVGLNGYLCTAQTDCDSGLNCQGLALPVAGICSDSGLKTVGISCQADSECASKCCSPINGPKLYTCQAASDCAPSDPQG